MGDLLPTWDEFCRDLENLDRDVRRNQAVNINSAVTKAAAKGLVRRYFSENRPQLEQIGLPEGQLSEQDDLFQRLIKLSRGNNNKGSYINLLRLIKNNIKNQEVDLYRIRSTADRPETRPTFSTKTQESIYATLSAIIPTAAQSYWQAARDLSNDDRASYRGSAAELRETVREVIDHLLLILR